MLGWFSPRSPLEPTEKAWVEMHMLMLARKWGLPRLLAVQARLPEEWTTSPTKGTYRGTLDNAQAIAEQLCRPLGIAARRDTHRHPLDESCSTVPQIPQADHLTMVTESALQHPLCLGGSLWPGPGTPAIDQ